MSVKSTHQLLVDGRARIERGWIQGIYRDSTGAVCALGAVGYGRGARDLPKKAYAAARLLRECLPGGFHSVHTYNDYWERTKEEILDLFDCAIAKASKEAD